MGPGWANRLGLGSKPRRNELLVHREVATYQGITPEVSIKRRVTACLSLSSWKTISRELSASTPLPTPEHLPLTCDYEFQGVARLYLDKAGPVRVVAAAVTTYARTRYVDDGEGPVITGGSPELH